MQTDLISPLVHVEQVLEGASVVLYGRERREAGADMTWHDHWEYIPFLSGGSAAAGLGCAEEGERGEGGEKL